MAATRKRYYQGEDIIFDFSMTNDGGVTFVNIDDLIDVVIYMYQDPNDDIIKFSKLDREGFIQLTKTTEYSYRGIIDSSLTKYMVCGTWYVEINVMSTNAELEDLELNRIGRTECFKIEQAAIRVESNILPYYVS